MDGRLQALRDLLSEPQQNFAAVGTAVSIVVILVILIVLALIVAALPGRDEDAHESPTSPTESGPEKRRMPRWLSVATIALVASVGVVASFVLWYHSTSSNQYCTSTCHSMAEPTRTWAVSAHQNVDCIRCHEGRKWESWPIGLAGRTQSLLLEVTGRRGGSRPVDEENCLDCHRGLLETPLMARNSEIFTHGELMREGRTCLSCHGAQGHELAR